MVDKFTVGSLLNEVTSPPFVKPHSYIKRGAQVWFVSALVFNRLLNCFILTFDKSTATFIILLISRLLALPLTSYII